MLSFNFYSFKRTKIGNDAMYLKLDEKGKCRKKRENAKILLHLGSNSVIIFEKDTYWCGRSS